MRENIDDKLKLLDCLIHEALDMLYEKDMHLIMNRAVNDHGRDEKHHVGERSIVFRFAHYLQNLIDNQPALSGYDLDCEYNRNGAACKALPSFPNGTYPDVIIHKRGSNEHNLIVIEFKTYWNRDTLNDQRKLYEFTDPNGQYKFDKGISILLGKKREQVKELECTNYKKRRT